MTSDFHKRVNRFLAEWVSAINALVAIGIPVVAALVAGGLAGNSFGRFSLMGFLGGSIAGGASSAPGQSAACWRC